jgi:hypothetical protein
MDKKFRRTYNVHTHHVRLVPKTIFIPILLPATSIIIAQFKVFCQKCIKKKTATAPQN